MDKEATEEKTGAPVKSRKTLKCYKCGKFVTEFDAECPHCGATAPKRNTPAVLFRIILGVVLGIVFWILYKNYF